MGYGKASREAVENAPVGGGADFWTPPEGESRVRVMPPWTQDIEEFWFATATHFNVGPDERAVACPEQSGVADSCYLCRLVKRLLRGDDDEKTEGEAMGARPRYLLNIVDLTKPQNGVQVWPAPKTIFRQLKKFWLNEEDYGDFTSFGKEGFDILVEKTGSGINTKYDATPTRARAFPSDKLLNHANASVAETFQALADEEYDLPDLAKVQNFLSDEEMERTYEGRTSGATRTESKSDNGDNDDDDEPKKSSRSSRPARRSEPKDEPDAEPDTEPDAEPEEEPADEPEDASGDDPKDESDDEPETRTRKPKPDSKKTRGSGSKIRGRVTELD